MNEYYRMYSETLKENFMIVIVTLILLFPTFFIWVGIPIYFVGNAIANLSASKYLIYLGISLSGGLLFSLYFLPFNLKIARKIAAERKKSLLQSFLPLEMVWVLGGALIWGLGIGIVFQ